MNNIPFEVLAALEIQRKQIVAATTKGIIGIALAVIGFILFANLGLTEIGAVLGLTLLIAGIVILVKINPLSIEYKKAYKSRIITTCISNLDNDLKYTPEFGIAEDEFLATKLFDTEPDRYHSEDFIEGKIDKISFYLAEVHAEEERQVHNGKQTKTEWVDIFRGILFCADFNKNFNAITIIQPKGFGSKLGAWLSKNIFSFGNTKIVALENPTFSENFMVWSGDQIEARYILTPAMMERICQLADQSPYMPSFSFIHSKMYIAFPLDRNYFEAPLTKSLLNEGTLETDLKVLSFMYNIVKELDLNTRIWTKE